MAIPHFKYDFSDFNSCVTDIIVNPSYKNLNELKKELNRFFKDAECKEIIYTNNTDKLFFGMCCVPVIRDEVVTKIVQSTDKIRFDEYYIEIDSKLLSPTLNLAAREIVAILLHEVGHLVNDSNPTDEVRKCIDTYLAKNNENIVVSDSMNYARILAYGIKSAIRKISSIFEIKDDEIIADEFVVACGYGLDLESAFTKITRNGFNINKDVKDKLIVLSWTLRLYKDVKCRRISALKTLNRGQELTGSKIEAREMDMVKKRLVKIDDESLLESVFDDIREKMNMSRKSITYKGIRHFEDDLYEYNIRMKNLYDEDDALMMLRQLNIRISILDDYVSNEAMSENERDRWCTLLNKYRKLRDDLSNKAIRKSSIGDSVIQIVYPEIKGRR